MTLNLAQLRALATNIYLYFHKLDDPAADEIFVPVEHMKIDDEDITSYHATVRFVVNYCGRKVHNIRIKFKVDDKGRFLKNTFEYL